MKTFSAKPHEVVRQWILVDAHQKVLGRLASQIARRLMGKHRAIFTPHVDTGDYVIVINAKHIVVTGQKATQKIYYRHSGYPGGLREMNFRDTMARNPIFAIEEAVRGMLPKGPLGYSMFRKLKVYPEAEHAHAAQEPKLLTL